MEPLNILGCLAGGNVLYRLTGSQGIDYDLRFLVTDFHGRSWRASFSLRDVLESLDAYEPEEEELLQWIRNCLDSPGQPPKLLKAPGGKVQAVQAFHSIHPMSERDEPIMIRLLFPPTDGLEEVSGKHAQVDSQALARALFDAYCKERRAAAGASRERDKLQQQVSDLEASCNKLQDKLRELKPGAVLSSSGSFKRLRDSGSLGILPTGTQGPESPRATGHQSVASPRAAASQPHEDNAAHEAPEAPDEGPTPEGQKEEPRMVTGVGRARVVHVRGRGRSRGRALPGLTARIGGRK
ncbi:g4444 [Coccomyxa elongata]